MLAPTVIPADAPMLVALVVIKRGLFSGASAATASVQVTAADAKAGYRILASIPLYLATLINGRNTPIERRDRVALAAHGYLPYRPGGHGVAHESGACVQFKQMECPGKQRLIDEYFEAFKRQQWIMHRLESIRADGGPQLISVGERQAEAAAEECYDAWRAMNEHQCSERCEE